MFILEALLYAVGMWWPVGLLFYAGRTESKRPMWGKISSFSGNHRAYADRYSERSYRNAKRWVWVGVVVWIAGIGVTDWAVNNLL